MNKLNTLKNLSGLVMLGASALLSTNALGREEYVAPTGAKDCRDCHNDLEGNGYKPDVLNAWNLGGLEGLTAFIESLNNTGETNTAPVLNRINHKWDITVGESPLVIPLQVTDKEDDSFALKGSGPSGYSVSKVYTKNNLPTIDFIWAPTATQANKTYTINFFVEETGVGRDLTSNTVKAKIKVWPARKTKTKQVDQFMLQRAKWKNNLLTLNGQLTFKKNITARQRKKALSNLKMTVFSIRGKKIRAPVKLFPKKNGSWSKTFKLSANQTPCTIKLNYEGLKVSRSVSQVPRSSCVK